MVKINKKWVDNWSIPHFTAGYLFGRYTNIGDFEFTFLNIGFEIFESFLKKKYDVFNIPFGRETVLECPMNSICDIFIAESGYALGRYVKNNYETEQPVDYWSIVHFGAGVGFGILGVTPKYFIPIELGWEIFEEGVLAKQSPFWQESISNKILDVVIGTTGCFIGILIRDQYLS